MQHQVDRPIEAHMDNADGHRHGSDVAAPRWLTELRPLDLCALAGALGFVAYRFLCG